MLKEKLGMPSGFEFEELEPQHPVRIPEELRQRRGMRLRDRKGKHRRADSTGSLVSTELTIGCLRGWRSVSLHF